MQRFISVDDISQDTLNNVQVILVSMSNPVSGEKDTASDGYIPGAVKIDLDAEGSDHSGDLPHTLLSAQAMATLLGGLGISASTTLLLYDNYGLFCAPRLWWMLKALGHQRVCVLNGGMPAWKAKGLPVSQSLKSLESIEPVQYLAQPQADWFCNSDGVVNALDNPDVTILDARSRPRFNGEVAEPRAGLRSGHMPGAVNVPFTELLTANKSLASSDTLKSYFSNANIGLEQRLLCSCGSGVTACIVGMAALECGAQQVTVYDGSWAEWGAGNTFPVVTKHD